MLGAGVLAFQSTVGSVVLLLLCGAWVGVNQPFEGPVLVTVVRRKHGLTTADLVAVAGALVAIGALLNR